MVVRTRRASKQKLRTQISFTTLKVGKNLGTVPQLSPLKSSEQGVKRRRSDVKDGNSGETFSNKSRKLTIVSNPGAGTRSQQRALQQLLDEKGDEKQSLIITLKIRHNIMQVDEPLLQIPTKIQAADDAEVPTQEVSATLTEVTDLVGKIEPEDTDNEVKAEQDARINSTSTWATLSQVTERGNILEDRSSDPEDKVEGGIPDTDVNISAIPVQTSQLAVVSDRRTSTTTVKARSAQKGGVQKSAVAAVHTVQTTVQQTTLLGHVRTMPPPPPSKGKKFKLVKLRYSRGGGTGRLPMDLVQQLPIHTDCLDDNDNLNLPPRSKFWDSSKLKIKFEFSPYLARPDPKPESCYEVLSRLEKWHLSLDPPIHPTSRGAAYNVEGFNIGCFFKTILAQGTDNRLAIQAERICAHYFPFVVDGKLVVGKTPNYHAMAEAPFEHIAASIQRCGNYRGKAKAFKSAMDAVKAMNIEMLKEANDGVLPPDTEPGQPANTSTFVPGLLSCDFLFEKGKSQLWNWFISLHGIGHKSTACFLEFNFGFPICAVDTHVVTMSKYLAWALRHWSELETFRHLEGRIPNPIKHALHQAFWHHRQVCERCKLGLARHDPGRPGTPACPIEDVVVRFKDPKNGKAGQPVPNNPNRKWTAKKAKSPDDIGKKPREPTTSTIIAWAHFATAALALKEGYVPLEYSMDDDFAAGSVNVSVRREWWYRGFAEKLWEKKVAFEEAQEDLDDDDDEGL